MVKRGPFTEDEDRAILAAHAIHGNKWAVISRSIPGRYEPRTPRLRLTHPEHHLVVRPATLHQLRVTRRLVCQFFGPSGRNFAPELANPSLFFHDSTRTYSVPESIFAFARRGIQIPLLSYRKRNIIDYYSSSWVGWKLRTKFLRFSRLTAVRSARQKIRSVTSEADLFCPRATAGRITR